MNWKEISKKYPRSWAISKWHPFAGSRQLYDIFDENEIYINIERFVDLAHNVDWISHIGNTSVKNDSSSRIEAEEYAFEKAFEILEEKLT